jgi:predicted lactoylglutathione lyase
MSNKLYINLPVADLLKATAFYEAIGFTKNLKFSNADASGLAYNDEFSLMLLTHDFTKTFLPSNKTIADSHATCEVLNALQLDSKEAVDAFVQKAITAGGKITLEYDHGFMYGRDFEDLDGHIWEIFWMDASQMPAQG